MYKIAVIIAAVIISVNTASALPGSGTEADPWRIESLADFNDFAADPNYWDDHTRLETDINLAGITYTTAVIAPDGDNAFTGVFDGNGHGVSVLRVWRVFPANSQLGLFGYNQGQISNLGVEDISVIGDDVVGGLVGRNNGGSIVNCYSTGITGGDICVGGLAGSNEDGVLLNCYSTCMTNGDDRVGGLVGANGGIVSNCHSTGNANGEDDVGGLIGYNHGIISKCYSTGTVTGENRIGGLVGQNSHGSVSSCYSIGDVNGAYRVGGLVGKNSNGTVLKCCSTGDVSGEFAVGGLLGHNYGSGVSSSSNAVSNCYSISDVCAVDTGDNRVGGLVGWNQHGGVSNCFWDIETQNHGVTESIGANSGTVTNVAGLPTVEIQMESTFISAGWDFFAESANGTSETWQMPAGGGYPVLSFFYSEAPFPLSGRGTAGDPYLINDANELGMVNWYSKDSYFKVINDIDLSEIDWSLPVVPVFGGCFDGDGHKLVNVQISGRGWLGLFGWLGQDAEVKNLNLEEGSISGTGLYVGGLAGRNAGVISNCSSTVHVSGGYQVGGLVGYNSRGTVSECYFAGHANGIERVGGIVGYSHYGLISGCSFAGYVNGTAVVGGLVGFCNSGIVLASYSDAAVTASGGGAGGLAGANSGGTILVCHSASDVSGIYAIGGLAGSSSGSVSECYFRGDVNGVEETGCVVGLNGGSVANCFWDTQTQSHGVTESVGVNDEGSVTNVAGLSTADMQMRSTFISAGWDFIGESANGTREWWQMPVGSGYPVLHFPRGDMPFPLSGSGTVSDPYLISDANELGMVNWYPEDSCFELVGDMDLSGISWYESVVLRFNGLFEGSGHKLTNVQISGGGPLGLFNYLGEDGEVCNLGIEGGSVSGTMRSIGGFVGINEGSISNCYFAGDIGGARQVGGLIGYNSYGSMSSSYFSGLVSASEQYAGGLIGQNRGPVSNCYAIGQVSGNRDVGGLIGYNYYSSLSNCYSAVDVNGIQDVGGLIGYNYWASVANCFWDTQIQTHGVADRFGRKSGGDVTNVVGLPTSDMQTESVFVSAGWGFVDIWDLGCEGMNYPRLVWEIPAGDLACPHGVDSRDYSSFADRWMDTNCGEADDCDGADLDFSGTVNAEDLAILCGHWLEGAGQ